MCKKHGVAPPSFEERQDFLIVTFKTSIDESVKEILKPSATGSKPIQSATQSNDPVHRLLIILQSGDLSSGQLREALNIKHRPTFRQNYLHPALKAGWIEHTIPDKPNSRLQKYRLTDKGKRYIAIPGEKG